MRTTNELNWKTVLFEVTKIKKRREKAAMTLSSLNSNALNQLAISNETISFFIGNN